MVDTRCCGCSVRPAFGVPNHGLPLHGVTSREGGFNRTNGRRKQENFELPSRRFRSQNPGMKHLRVVGPQPICTPSLQQFRKVLERMVGARPIATHHHHACRAARFNWVFGNGLLGQVVLKVCGVHHPKVPPPYLRISMGKHLIIGASGQLGVELMLGLQKRHGPDQVVLSDLRPSPNPDAALSPFVTLDARDKDGQRAVIEGENIEVVYNLVAMLSAKGEQDPMAAWALNMEPLLHTLELAREGLVEKVFWPSSIAVFGPDAPKLGTPQDAALNPTTVYGVSKTAGELWCKYYHETFGVDVRSIRYPGLIGFRSMPGGGTTDYAVDAFHCAMEGRPLTCYPVSYTHLTLPTTERV